MRQSWLLPWGEFPKGSVFKGTADVLTETRDLELAFAPLMDHISHTALQMDTF